MPPFQPPDMRVFDQTVARDHALFDGCLVRLCDEKSNWTKSRLQGQVPVALAHFRYDTQRRLAAHLRQTPDFQREDLSDRRIILQHIAHWFTILSAKYLHTWQEPMEEVIMAVRSNLRIVMQERKIVLQDSQHPLQRHPMKRIGDFQECCPSGCSRVAHIDYVPAKPPDALIAQYIVGPRPLDESAMAHTARILQSISPWLMELDAGQMDIQLLPLRGELRRQLQGRQHFTDSLRHDLVTAIVADWERTYFAAGDATLFDTIAAEVREETGVEDIFNEPAETQIRECFSRPLAQELTDRRREQLLRRRPVLELLVRQAIESEDEDRFKSMCRMVLEYRAALDLSYGAMEHLGLLTYAAVSEDVSIFRSMLG